MVYEEYWKLQWWRSWKNIPRSEFRNHQSSSVSDDASEYSTPKNRQKFDRIDWFSNEYSGSRNSDNRNGSCKPTTSLTLNSDWIAFPWDVTDDVTPTLLVRVGASVIEVTPGFDSRLLAKVVCTLRPQWWIPNSTQSLGFSYGSATYLMQTKRLCKCCMNRDGSHKRPPTCGCITPGG